MRYLDTSVLLASLLPEAGSSAAAALMTESHVDEQDWHLLEQAPVWMSSIDCAILL
jgi:hypothetical protein